MYWRQVVAEAKAQAEGRSVLKASRDFLRGVQTNFTGSWSGYERDRMYVNPDGPHPRFIDAAYSLGLDLDDDGRAALPLDVDGDGDLDLAVLSLQGLHLLENTSPPRSFARVRLKASKTEPLAIGAIVTLRAGGVVQRDHVKVADGFLALLPTDLHFGLGDAKRIDEVTVKWRSGATQTWKDLPVNRLVTLTEGSDAAPHEELRSWPVATRPYTARWSTELSLPLVKGGAERLGPPGKPLVVNFWSPTCEPCKKELPALSKLSSRFSSSIRFAGVSVDSKDLAGIMGSVQTFGLEYTQFTATEEALRSFFGPEGNAPIPATFVFDAGGKLRRAFLRPVGEEELAALLDSFASEPTFWVDLGLRGKLELQKGNVKEALHWFARAVEARPTGVWERCEYGSALAAAGRDAEAMEQYDTAARMDPLYDVAMHVSRGNLRRRLGLEKESIPCFEAGLKLRPDYMLGQTGLAMALAKTGAIERALEVSAEAVKAHPDEPETFVTRGAVLQISGDKAGAESAYRKALELKPGHETATRLLKELRGE